MALPVSQMVAALVLLAVPAESIAQRSSLAVQDLPGREIGPLTMEELRVPYRQLPPPREIQLHDIITVLVDQKAQFGSEGEVERRKTALYDAVLNDWIELIGLKAIKPAPQSDGDPRVQGNLTQLYRASGEVETAEALRFEIAAQVVDIRPNGTLVLEAHRQVRNNNEIWEYSLNGVCRGEDIKPGNLLLSKDIAELNIYKRERGSVRDSYRRGWLTRWYDTFNPF